MPDLQLMNIRRQHERHAEEYEQAALSVLRSGSYIGGTEVVSFEEEFAAYAGASFGIACGNGTDALVIALRALRVGPGDEVVTTAATFYATAESIAAVGAVPVFVDILPDTYCMDPALAERAITPRTKAVLPVHLYGQSCGMDALKAVCRRHGLPLIMDCAQSAGTRYRDSRKNALGDISCFSFFPTKNLGCAGDGGMILTDDEELMHRCRALRAHGSGRDGLLALRAEYASEGRAYPSSLPCGETKYDNYLVGYNSRLDALQAAILRKKLTHLEEWVDRRRDNAAHYKEALRGTRLTLPEETPEGRHSYYLFAVRHPRAKELMALMKSRGIPCATYYPVPLHLQAPFARLGYRRGDLPNTELLSDTSFVLPIYPELLDEERTFVVRTMLECLAETDQNA